MTSGDLIDQPNATLDRDGMAMELTNIASKAGAAVMRVYQDSLQDGLDVINKTDGSPLTKADLAADEIVAQGLATIAPNIPVLSEESAETVDPRDLGDLFFVVDPLDGTREFVAQNADFSVNIALVQHGTPIVGVVYAPAHDKMWFAGDHAYAAKVQPGQDVDQSSVRTISTCAEPGKSVRAVASRSHRDKQTDAFLHKFSKCDTVAIGSALKFCLVAEGKADVYPRYSPTMVWDTAAGVAVLQAAGGLVVNEEGAPLKVRYGTNGWRNGAFTAWGCSQIKESATQE
jgi:3'(2'), 5'-bisphosphate nucleotidase